MSEPRYGLPVQVQGRGGCLSSLGALAAAVVCGLLALGVVVAFFHVSSTGWQLFWLVAGMTAGWLGVRAWAADRRTVVVWRCPHCGAGTDPSFRVCSSCHRVKELD